MLTRRSLVLMCFGAMFSITAVVGFLTTDPPPVTDSALRLAFHILSPRAWGWVLLGLGAFAIYAGLTRWHKALAFSALAGFCTTWALIYVAGWAFYGASVRSLASAAIYGLYAGILFILSGGLPEAHRR